MGSISPLILASPYSSSSSSTKRNARNLMDWYPDLPPGSRVFVRNLPYSTGEATLIKLFSKFGQIVEVKLAKHEQSKRSKGYAFIQYSSQDHAVLALEQMDQKRIDGRTIYAEIAKPIKNGFAAYPITSGPPSQQNI
ncbi:small RNA-binding protein 11, chloroplastic isoform X2 [Typha angustifolia]|uniref:small RNA-binding protein 11, chloroplastic isoform X2 n=1 Tax=Typha angustifolia TaxID=59011 RepID=UPI003C2EC8BF